MAVGCHHQGNYLTEVSGQWRSSVISGVVGVLQPHVLGLQLGRDLAHTGHTVLRVVLLVVVDRLVDEKDPVVEMLV